MAQDGVTAGGNSYQIDNVTFPVARNKLQSILDAIRSTNIGETAPDLVAGQFWIDNNTPSTTVWTLYFYDGTDSIQFATIDTINNTVNFIDSAFDLIVDTTPQLGGNLDLNSNNITGTGNIDITGTVTSDGLTVDGNANLTNASNPTLLVTDTTNSVITKVLSANFSGAIGTNSNHDFNIDSNGLTRITLKAGGEVVLNENSIDQDFRVESNNNTHTLFVDGGSDVVMIGKSNTSSAVAGTTLWSGGFLNSTVASAYVARFNRTTTDGDIVQIYKDNVSVGSINSTSVGVTGSIAIGTGDSGIMFAPSLDAVVPFNIGTNASRDTAIDLGYSTIRWKDLYLTGTVTNDGSGGMSIDTSGNVTFNEGGIDADFRVESDGLTHAFHLDGTDGNIGIGTTAISGARLDVNTASNGVFAGRFTNSHATGSYGIGVKGGNSSSNYTADFATKDGTSLMRIRGDGNVGIGTTSPSTTLEVAGTIKGTVTDNSYGLILESTDADALVGPRLLLSRNSATPADGDVLGQIVFNGTNDNYPEGHVYARIESKIQDASNATEDGILDFLTSVASSEGTSRIYIDSTGVTINDAGIDSDFRVESNNNTYALFVNGDTDRVSIGTSGSINNATTTILGNTSEQALALKLQSNGNSFLQCWNSSEQIRFQLVGDGSMTHFQGNVIFNESSTDSDFRVESNGNTHMLFVDAGSDEVGIGLSAPETTLHIYGANNDIRGQLKVESSSGDPQITFEHPLNGRGMYVDNSDNNKFKIYGGGGKGVNEFTIDNTGNVGINTASPSATLDLDPNPSGTSGVYLAQRIRGHTSTQSDRGLNIYLERTGGASVKHIIAGGTYDGTNYYKAQYTNTTIVEKFDEQSYKILTSPDDTNPSTTTPTTVVKEKLGIQYNQVVINESSEDVDFRVESNNNANALFLDGGNDRILFFTTVYGAAFTDTGAYINNSGQFVVRSNGSNYFNKVDSDGDVIRFYRGTTGAVGAISITTTATSYVTSSDYRLKENVVDITGATDRLKQLQPKRFNFIADEDTTVDGFLAHEVSDIVPEAITGTKDEVDADGNPVYQGIDQSKLVPLLTASLKEAINKIEQLEARISALET